MTGKLILALAIAFFISSGVGLFLVPWLRRIKAGQAIREDGPVWHQSKAGTPTMGGLMFIAAIAAVCLSVGFSCMLEGEYGHIFCLLFAMVFGGIGFLDDYEKLRKKQNLGLRAREKFLLQLAVSIAFLFLLRRFGYLKPNLYIPFLNVSWQMPEAVYFAFAAFVIVATVNAVNLTDGVDGLAAGTTIPVCMFFVILTYYWGERFLALGIFASAIIGGLMGFLVYNFNPAKVFMGDTGSLFLGGAVAALAFTFDIPMIIPFVGLMYVVEVLSDVIQVVYFKITHGKRIFRMAPFHHHLEMGGWTGKKWTEKELFVLFSGITFVMAAVSFWGVSGRFGM
ncbi:MAG: phospho-N-acetylmuramoyl-pentapeptide-transferase [Eubacteriales bacterium]|nr:phospho-N-acetylmuramoyl-pentapeptide-transferase [Eubacteriales bacterium]